MGGRSHDRDSAKDESGPWTDRERVGERLEEIISDAREREEYLIENELPGDSIGLPDIISGITDDWDSDRKSVRTVPVANSYEALENEPAPDEMLDILVGLDIYINSQDDAIDEESQSKYDRAVKSARSSHAIPMLIPEDGEVSARKIAGTLQRYFHDLYQIPQIEGEVIENLENGEDVVDNVFREAAYRGNGISGFSGIAMHYSNADADEKQQFVEDSIAFRGKELLYKDIHDVGRDLQDGDETPMIWLLRNYNVPEARNMLEEAFDRFEYEGGGPHVDVFRQYEPDLDRLEKDLRMARDTVLLYDSE